MKKVFLIVKHQGEKGPRVAKEVESFLKNKGIAINKGELHNDDEAIVVVGGDGTLLHVASLAFKRQIPLLGINAGGLGFLTEVHTDEMKEALDSLIKERFKLDERMVLSVKVFNGKNKLIKEYIALNEAVITKGALSKIIQIHTWADGDYLTTYKGDGLIISTATGSTGYNLSAGGPIVHPSLEVTILTPICPFALSARPLILSGNTTIKVKVQNIQEEVCLDIDGQVGLHLEDDYFIEITRMQDKLKLVKTPHRDYFTILREKLGWTTGIAL